VTVGPGNSFTPADIQVSPGATVTWTFTGGIDHTVTFPSTAIADSPTQSSGTFMSTMPTTAGTYSYACSIHSGMSGSVLVQ
jgi:plastocyanin